MALRFADLWRWDGKANGKTYAIVGIVGMAIKHQCLRSRKSSRWPCHPSATNPQIATPYALAFRSSVLSVSELFELCVKSFSCPLSTCSLNLTPHRRATSPRRKPVISPPHLTHHSRNLRQPNQRPSPPNLASHSKHSVRAAKPTPVRQQKTQFPQ